MDVLKPNDDKTDVLFVKSPYVSGPQLIPQITIGDVVVKAGETEKFRCYI